MKLFVRLLIFLDSLIAKLGVLSITGDDHKVSVQKERSSFATKSIPNWPLNLKLEFVYLNWVQSRSRAWFFHVCLLSSRIWLLWIFTLYEILFYIPRVLSYYNHSSRFFEAWKLLWNEMGQNGKSNVELKHHQIVKLIKRINRRKIANNKFTIGSTLVRIFKRKFRLSWMNWHFQTIAGSEFSTTKGSISFEITFV